MTGPRDLWFEDFTPGRRFETAGATLSEAQILDFAMQWDPQPFHLDVEAAKASPYGGLIASGFQTLLVAFRLFLAEGLIRRSSIGSPGMESLKWLKPVRPGDTIRVAVIVVEARPSRSKPDRGIAIADYLVTNQAGETVTTWRCTHLLLRRPEGS
jgi:acyl dehydratase